MDAAAEFGDLFGVTDLSLTETQEKRLLYGGGVLAAAALSPFIYDALQPRKTRSKRKQAKQTQERAALEKVAGIAREGVKTAFTSPYTAMPASIITLELLGRFPKAKEIYHPAVPEIGVWRKV